MTNSIITLWRPWLFRSFIVLFNNVHLKMIWLFQHNVMATNLSYDVLINHHNVVLGCWNWNNIVQFLFCLLLFWSVCALFIARTWAMWILGCYVRRFPNMAYSVEQWRRRQQEQWLQYMYVMMSSGMWGQSRFVPSAVTLAKQWQLKWSKCIISSETNTYH